MMTWNEMVNLKIEMILPLDDGGRVVSRMERAELKMNLTEYAQQNVMSYSFAAKSLLSQARTFAF